MATFTKESEFQSLVHYPQGGEHGGMQEDIEKRETLNLA